MFVNLAYLTEPTKLQLARAPDKKSAPSNAISELVSTLPEPCRQETRQKVPRPSAASRFPESVKGGHVSCWIHTSWPWPVTRTQNNNTIMQINKQLQLGSRKFIPITQYLH